MGNDVTDEQAKWRDDAIMRSQSTTLVERRVRMALGTGDRRGLNTAGAPADGSERERRMALLAGRFAAGAGTGKRSKRDPACPDAAARFLPDGGGAASGEEYVLKIDKAPGNVDNALTQGPEMARVRELMYWNLDNTARSEWANTVTSRTKTEQAQLARYAFNNQWWDLSVQATIAGKLWDHLEERFPLAYQDLFTRYTRGKDIPQSYAMAIARQESARTRR